MANLTGYGGFWRKSTFFLKKYFRPIDNWKLCTPEELAVIARAKELAQ
jgi:hypothetical protein